MTLNDREREILQTWLDCWDDADMPLVGDIPYGEALDLVNRLNLKVPRVLADICDGTFVRRMREGNK